ncbi:hypothetical protein EJ04DRAFT_26438 [Polyplosphaeria fusca]|uniref:Uncharacterized protein n=1 Tax=Polyplosphaeria fusca TaxID=682080 RepID=A0A9P4R3R0_9PLEO|nr:hypothetical protein EJ04DRAFT_26438 [Polyplosphaeria fusca]
MVARYPSKSKKLSKLNKQYRSSSRHFFRACTVGDTTWSLPVAVRKHRTSPPRANNLGANDDIQGPDSPATSHLLCSGEQNTSAATHSPQTPHQATQSLTEPRRPSSAVPTLGPHHTLQRAAPQTPSLPRPGATSVTSEPSVQSVTTRDP